MPPTPTTGTRPAAAWSTVWIPSSGQGPEGRPGQAALLCETPGRAGSGERRVRRDDPGGAGLDGGVHYGCQLVGLEIGRQLHEDRHLSGGRHHVAHQATQRFGGLQAPEAGRIGRADVDRQVVGHILQVPDAGQVVGGNRVVVQWRHLALSDVATYRYLGPAPGLSQHVQAARQGLAAVVVEAHAVDQAPFRHQPEQARRGVAGLGMGGHRAQLDEAEAEGGPNGGRFAVLVQAGGQTHRSGQGQGTQAAGQGGRRWTGQGTEEGGGQGGRGAQRMHDHAVRVLGLHGEEEGSCQPPTEVEEHAAV